ILCGTAATGIAHIQRLLAKENQPRFTLTTIAGKPRERGRQYGERYKGYIRAMIDREIYDRLVRPRQHTKDDLLRYAGTCAREVKPFAPLIHDEMEGRAEGPEGKVPPQHARCEVIHRLFDARNGPLDRAAMEAAFAEKIVGAACLDVMIFNTTKKEAILSRGP